MTVADLSAASGLGVSTIYRLERGGLPRAAGVVLERVAAALRCTVDDLDAAAPRSESAEADAIVRRLAGQGARHGLRWLRQLEQIAGILASNTRPLDGGGPEEGQDGQQRGE